MSCCFEGFSARPAGTAAGIDVDPKQAGFEAACKLSANFEKVVRDITNPTGVAIGGGKLTQKGLPRVAPKNVAHVRAVVSAVCARCLDKETISKPTTAEEAGVWLHAAQFLHNRLQGSDAECQGRKPDMGRRQADAMLDGLGQIEAACKLMNNADTVVKDMTNLGARGVFKNVKTQAGLARLSPKHQLSLEAMVRELANNLFGKTPVAAYSEPDADEAAVWAAAAGFFGKRVQDPEDEVDVLDRPADMSMAAAKQLRAKCARMEACYKLISNRDRVIQDMCNSTSKTIESGKDATQPGLARVANRGAAVGVIQAAQRLLCAQSATGPSTLEDAQAWHQAATFLAARVQDDDAGPKDRAPDLSNNGASAMGQAVGAIEASCKLMLNHEVVAQDITNSSGAGVAEAVLTMPELKRLNPCNYPTVSAMLREVCNRLLGQRVSSPTSPGEAQIWGDAAEFFSKRIQASAAECRGRTPDMTAGAAAALRAVLQGIGSRDKIDASSMEAARALMANRHRVCSDIANAGPDNIDGKTLTQTDLKRVSAEDRPIVDQMYSAVCSRLVGKAPMTKPSTMREVNIWADAAAFLQKRVQATPEQMPERSPDMSAGAAQAFASVCKQIENESARTKADAAEASKLLSANKDNVINDITNDNPDTQTNLVRVKSVSKNIVKDFYAEVINVLGGAKFLSLPPDSQNVQVWGRAARYLSSRAQGSAEEMRGRSPDMSPGAAAALRMVLDQINQATAAAAAGHTAAEALLNNKEKVSSDITNASPLTQKELTRANAKDKNHVDAFIEELANRLKGKTGKPAASPDQASVWAVAIPYFANRLQGTADSCPGRGADMAPDAAQAMWMSLAKMASDNDQAATANAAKEAAGKFKDSLGWGVSGVLMLKNDEGGPDLQIESQKEAVLAMVNSVCDTLEGKKGAKASAAQAAVWITVADYLSSRPGRAFGMSAHGANAVKAVLAKVAADSTIVSNLNGGTEAAKVLRTNKEFVAKDIANAGGKAIKESTLTQTNLERVNSANKAMVENMLDEVANCLEGKATNKSPTGDELGVWAAAAAYLAGRVQGSAGECPGRAPDMSPGAAKALKGVLAKIEARCKLQANQKRVAEDINNSAPVTQLHLTRAGGSAQAKQSVDDMITVACDRLQGKSATKPLDDVGKAAASFLSKRVQGDGSDMPGRQPDMSSGAAAALRAVLSELGDQAARKEAAGALQANQKKVVADIVNGSLVKNIDGIALTQKHLARVDASQQAVVDAMIANVIKVLMGQPGAKPSGEQAFVWAQAASYLSKRVQGSSGECSGRKADMSNAAAVALRTVLAEFC
jgi:hypothetical protein